MSPTFPPPLSDAHGAVCEAAAHYEAAVDAELTAREDLEQKRAQLAAAIRAEAQERGFSVNALIGAVSAAVLDESGVARWSPVTVRNALYETFQPDILSACVDFLSVQQRKAA